MTPLPSEVLPRNVPTVRAWRRSARAARREHHPDTLRERLTDAYGALLFLLIYGAGLYTEVMRHLAMPGAAEGAAERHWLGVAVLLAGAGLAWRALRSLGPMFVSPAEHHWAVSSPMSRRAWFVGRLTVVVLCGIGLGGIVTFCVHLLGIQEGGFPVATLAGAACGGGLAATSVVAQATDSRWWSRLAGVVLLCAGGVAAAAVVLAHRGGLAVSAPPRGIGWTILVLAIPFAGYTTWGALRALPRLNRIRLRSGAQIADALVTAAVMYDVTVLRGVLDARRWRGIARVRSRRLVWPMRGAPGLVWTLIQAEATRTVRRWDAWVAWAGLAVAQYAIQVAAPSLGGVVRLILGYVAAGLMMTGLRTISGSPALRRALGGSDRLLRAIHLVVPVAATVLWWVATIPTDGVGLGLGGWFLVGGLVAAAYRSATRAPMDYDVEWVESPFGPIPIGLFGQIARGLDILGVLIAIRVWFW